MYVFEIFFAILAIGAAMAALYEIFLGISDLRSLKEYKKALREEVELYGKYLFNKSGEKMEDQKTENDKKVTKNKK